jgi:NAD(P)H-dependent flavin oxidoreductase YrpB (nitropropane dioxygenase family)
VRGKVPIADLLEQVRAAVDIPVLAAGGIVDRDGVRGVLELGAVAAVVGTRFLLSYESHAHGEYKRRCTETGETVLTELFGFGWPDAPHRVIPNAATRRWLAGDPRGPEWLRALNRRASPLLAHMPGAAQARATRFVRPGVPILGPQPPTDDGPPSLVEAGPLYAGANVGQISDLAPAASLVAALTP